jgi:hypothetical protein
MSAEASIGLKERMRRWLRNCPNYLTPGNAYVMTSDYVTAAKTRDGTLTLACLPSRRTITVDLGEMSAPVTARWYDPSRGTCTAVEGSPLPNDKHHMFKRPGNNGDGGWRLGVSAGDREAVGEALGGNGDIQNTPRSRHSRDASDGNSRGSFLGGNSAGVF